MRRSFGKKVVPSEREVTERFIGSGILRGNWEREVGVGMKHLKRELEEIPDYYNASEKRFYPFLKRIDLICESEGAIWILEVKSILDVTAIGQVLLYKHLYEMDNPTEKDMLKMGIVCWLANITIEDVCNKHGIVVFSETQS